MKESDSRTHNGLTCAMIFPLAKHPYVYSELSQGNVTLVCHETLAKVPHPYPSPSWDLSNCRFSFLKASKTSMSVLTDDLGHDHLAAFKTALSNVLSRTLAKNTFAPVIDGLPTLDIWRE